jgi:phosphoribosylanthranilate isomerase
MTRVKICGLTNREDVGAAVDAGADAVGVIADVPVDTHRAVTPGTAADLLADVPPYVAAVLVTMPEAPDRAIELVEQVDPDVLQINGEVSPDELASLSASLDVDLVRAVDAETPGEAHEVTDMVDAVVVDSLTDGAGGTGHIHDWHRTREAVRDLDVPVVLAGGLTPGNVGEAIETVDPFAVDVASGVEGEDGRKDHDSLQAFVKRAAETGRH